MAAPDKPNNVLIAAFLVGCCATVAAMVVGIIQLFTVATKEELTAKVFAPRSAELVRTRTDEEARLRVNQWVDKDKGVVRLHVDRAAELTVRDYRKRQGPKPGGTPQ